MTKLTGLAQIMFFVSGKSLIQVMSEKYEIVRKEIFQKYKNTAEIIIYNDSNI